jgi:hypothetical protein
MNRKAGLRSLFDALFFLPVVLCQDEALLALDATLDAPVKLKELMCAVKV